MRVLLPAAEFRGVFALPRQLFARFLVRFGLIACGLGLIAGGASDAAAPLGYNRDVRSILADKCFACHGADSASREAGLRLDQRDAAIDMGAIVPGDFEASELVARIDSDDAGIIMPPPEVKKPLSEEEKSILRRWIAEGAEYEPHWAFIPPESAPLPEVEQSAWPRNAIDFFVLQKLEAQGLAPNPEADPARLFRRLHLDITGLPPAPQLVQDFVADYRPGDDAVLSRWIDRLMQSPTWGEHRGRYWLDAARYADTHGMHFDNYREMWPYRDWVIRAFNQNMPFDQMTVEQLAGDLLPDPTLDQLIATGFQRCNITTNEGGTIDEENLANYAVDRVQTFGWVYLGLTTNCAQCHDHKFDPLSQKDFYSLAAYFRNTTQPAKDGNVADGRGPTLRVPRPEDRRRWDALPAEIATAKQAVTAEEKAAESRFEAWLAEVDPDTMATEPSRAGLVAHLPLDEAGGTEVADTSDSKGAWQVPESLGWDREAGRTGVRIVPEKTLTHETLGDFDFGDAFSMGAWIKTGNKSTNGAILSRMDVGKDYRGYDLWQQGQQIGVHMIDAWPSNSMKLVSKQKVLKPGKWQHVFATYDGSRKPAGIKIFVDGQAVELNRENATLKPHASLRTEAPLRIGQRSTGAPFTDGVVSEVRIYERALEPTEIKQLSEGSQIARLLRVAEGERTAPQIDRLRAYYLHQIDADYRHLHGKLVSLEAERQAIRDRSPITHIQEERKDRQPMAHILVRGEYDNPGEQVMAAPPESLHAAPEAAPPNRLGLARWTVAPENPLTARVTVNRFWQQLFGRGIVATPEDFGVMGAKPTHPELLDWLAVDFVENGWDVKRYFKQVFLSATYRQAATVTPEKLELDFDNALLSRGPRFRMDGEMLRDLALSTSGLLSQKMFGPSVKPAQPEAVWDVVGLPGSNTRNYRADQGEDAHRRSVYTFWKRMAPPPNMEAFNAPNREVCTVQRERTNTPLQALVALNDPQFVQAARHLAQIAIATGPEDDERLETIGVRVLARPWSDAERALLTSDLDAYREYYRANVEDAKALIAVGGTAAPESLAAAELAAWTMLCNQVLNLDETLNK